MSYAAKQYFPKEKLIKSSLRTPECEKAG